MTMNSYEKYEKIEELDEKIDRLRSRLRWSRSMWDELKADELQDKLWRLEKRRDDLLGELEDFEV